MNARKILPVSKLEKSCSPTINAKGERSSPPTTTKGNFWRTKEKTGSVKRLISSTAGSQIVVVGDDAQSIYGFRHANFIGIREIWDSEEWGHIRFTKSHRLPVSILRASQALISGENYLGGEVDIPKDNEKRINTFQCTTSDLQIDVVACLIDDIKSKSSLAYYGEKSHSTSIDNT